MSTAQSTMSRRIVAIPASLLQLGSVIMTPAAPQARTVRVDGDQRHEDEIGLHHWRPFLRLDDSERAGFERISCKEAEGLRGVGKGWKRDDSADRARFLHRQHWADLAAERMISGDNCCVRAERRQMLGKLLLQEGAMRVVQRADERLARFQCC